MHVIRVKNKERLKNSQAHKICWKSPIHKITPGTYMQTCR